MSMEGWRKPRKSRKPSFIQDIWDTFLITYKFEAILDDDRYIGGGFKTLFIKSDDKLKAYIKKGLNKQGLTVKSITVELVNT